MGGDGGRAASHDASRPAAPRPNRDASDRGIGPDLPLAVLSFDESHIGCGRLYCGHGL